MYAKSPLAAHVQSMLRFAIGQIQRVLSLISSLFLISSRLIGFQNVYRWACRINKNRVWNVAVNRLNSETTRSRVHLYSFPQRGPQSAGGGSRSAACLTAGGGQDRCF